MVESGFSHIYYLLSKQGNTLHIEWVNLKLQLKNLQLNIHDLNTHQINPFHQKIIQELNVNLCL